MEDRYIEIVKKRITAMDELTGDSLTSQYINDLKRQISNFEIQLEWHDLTDRDFKYPDDSRQVLVAYTRHPWGYSDFDVVSYSIDDDWYNLERPVAAWREI